MSRDEVKKLMPSFNLSQYFERAEAPPGDSANVTEPDKQLHEYPGAFHQVHNDLGHEAAIADLLAWLERHLSPTSVS